MRCLECGASIPVDFDGGPPSRDAPETDRPPFRPVSVESVRPSIVPPQDKCRACYYDDCPHGDDSDCIGCSKENGWSGFRARKA